MTQRLATEWSASRPRCGYEQEVVTVEDVKVILELDLDADAAYIRLSHEAVAQTVEVNDEVVVDLDRNGVVVGIETLRVSAPIPFTELETRFHVHSDVIGALRLVRPSPQTFLEFRTGSDGVSSSPLATLREPV